MGGEWSKAVKMIFNKKYSNGRGKLVDAMKDPETKAIHSSMLGKKPMKQTKFMKAKNMNVNKTQKFKKKMRGGQNAEPPNNSSDIESRLLALEMNVAKLMGTASMSDAPPMANGEGEGEGEGEDEVEDENNLDNRDLFETEKEKEAKAAEAAEAKKNAKAFENLPKMPGGKRSKKNRSNKKKDKKGKSFRKKCGW